MENPVPPEKYNELYFRKFSSRSGKGFASVSKFHPFYDQTLALVDEGKAKTVLDVGCGCGEIVYLCAIRGYQSFGIDFSEAAIGESKKLLRSLPEEYRKNAQVQKMDAKKLRFKDGIFDTVLMADLVEHLHPWELQKAFSECRRVLKPKGQLVIHTSPNKFVMQPVRFLAGLMGTGLRSDEFHINEQTAPSLRKCLADSFVVKRLWMEKEKNYWSNGVPERGGLVKLVARVVDWSLDNPLSEFLITKTFLRFFLGTGIWVVACPRKKE